MEQVNLDAMLARFAEHWSPKKIAQVNDYDVRIVKVQGEFTWHQHPDTDEFFLVLSGQLTIQMRDRDVVLAPWELFVVPQGVEHCPRTGTETALLLFEPSSVVNTGDAGGELHRRGRASHLTRLPGSELSFGLTHPRCRAAGTGHPDNARPDRRPRRPERSKRQRQ